MTTTPAAASSILFWAQFSPDFQDRDCETLAVSDAIYKQLKPVLYYYGQLQIELLLCTLHESGDDRCGTILTRVLQGYVDWSLYRVSNIGQWSVSLTTACFLNLGNMILPQVLSAFQMLIAKKVKGKAAKKRPF